MPPERHPSRVILDVDVGRSPARAAAPDPDRPFRLGVLGDFSGRGAREPTADASALGERAQIRVDRDDLDDVLARFAPRVRLPFGGERDAPHELDITELDDFHPDALVDRVPLVGSLLELKARLEDPATFAAAAAGLGAAQPRAAPRPVPANLLERIVEESGESTTANATGGRGDLREFVDSVVAPHRVAGETRLQRELVDKADAAVAAALRAVLHDPGFRALEALWRSVDLLVRRIETGGTLRIELIDVTREELVADLTRADSVEESALYRLLVDRSVGAPGTVPWAVFAGAYDFGETPEDAAVLARLAELAAAAGAPWIAAAHPRLLGARTLSGAVDPAGWTHADRAWQDVRRSAHAEYLGLVSPRFLVRIPYGERGEPCDRIRFEEIADAPDHEDFLWASPTFICAILLAETFTASGWTMRPATRLDIPGLPFYVLQVDGEAVAVPCAETVLSERAAAAMLDAGIMPLVTIKDTDAVRLLRFQSVAAPVRPLAGSWSGPESR